MRVSSRGGNLDWKASQQEHLVRIGQQKEVSRTICSLMIVIPLNDCTSPSPNLTIKKFAVKCLCHTLICKCKKKMKKSQLMDGIHLIEIIN